MHSLYQSIDDFLFLEPDDRISLCQDHRAIVRLPARSVRATARSLWLLFICSWTTLLLPVTFYASVRKAPDDASESFWLEYFALLPCIGLFRYGSETLSLSAPSAAATIWNATIGAFSLDLEVVLLAIQEHHELVKSYIVGKTIATTLLTRGICAAVAGAFRPESRFDAYLASTLAQVLMVSFVPFAIVFTYAGSLAYSPSPWTILPLSRVIASILLALYCAYVRFETARRQRDQMHEIEQAVRELDADHHVARRFRSAGPVVALAVVLGTTTIAYGCAKRMLAALHRDSGPGENFVGFVLLPLLAEAVDVPQLWWYAKRGQVQVSLEVAAGLGVQVLLFVAPMVCLIGWMLGREVDLLLKGAEVMNLFVSIWVFAYLIRPGRSNYLEGCMSIALYIIEISWASLL